MATRIRTSTRVGAANFDKRMKMAGQRVVTRSNQGVKDLASLIVRDLIGTTPKKTGQAAANWKVSLDVIDTEFRQGFTNYSNALSTALAAINTRKSGQTLFIVNNTPYITLLNMGSSTQAPASFIERVMVRAYWQLKNTKLLT